MEAVEDDFSAAWPRLNSNFRDDDDNDIVDMIVTSSKSCSKWWKCGNGSKEPAVLFFIFGARGAADLSQSFLKRSEKKNV